mmetsp:Transcript_8013/g.14732  ORF Transcript_8013/g.14732 Transcript_8013/m.14732 type:complete len:262 (+) Transcript_8013:1272-2057(+)
MHQAAWSRTLAAGLRKRGARRGSAPAVTMLSVRSEDPIFVSTQAASNCNVGLSFAFRNSHNTGRKPASITCWTGGSTGLDKSLRRAIVPLSMSSTLLLWTAASMAGRFSSELLIAPGALASIACALLPSVATVDRLFLNCSSRLFLRICTAASILLRRLSPTSIPVFTFVLSGTAFSSNDANRLILPACLPATHASIPNPIHLRNNNANTSSQNTAAKHCATPSKLPPQPPPPPYCTAPCSAAPLPSPCSSGGAAVAPRAR